MQEILPAKRIAFLGAEEMYQDKTQNVFHFDPWPGLRTVQRPVFKQDSGLDHSFTIVPKTLTGSQHPDLITMAVPVCLRPKPLQSLTFSRSYQRIISEWQGRVATLLGVSLASASSPNRPTAIFLTSTPQVLYNGFEESQQVPQGAARLPSLWSPC